MSTMTYHVTGRLHGRSDPDVTLPAAPWDAETARPDPRPETAPRRGIASPAQASKVEAAIAAIRAERDRVARDGLAETLGGTVEAQTAISGGRGDSNEIS